MRVCILGSGLSAYTLAKALVNQNIQVNIIQNQYFKKPDKIRTIGITKTNIDFFNSKILNIDKIKWEINKIEIFSENFEKKKLIDFKKKNSEPLFSIVKNSDLVDSLKKSLIKNKYFELINLKKNSNFTNDFNLIINTDYYEKISKKFFNKKIVKKYNSIAYITIIDHEKLKNNIATQIFTKNGPLAFLPVSNNVTSVVFSDDSLNIRNNDSIRNLIDRYNFKYKIRKINEVKFFELESLNLRSYYNKNILAFGDLIHRIHPLAGQGFNMTIRDIKTLLEIINNKLNLGLPIDSSVCKEFEKKTRHKNFIFSTGIDFTYEFFNLERRIKSNFLSKSVQSVGKNVTINKIFTKLADEGLFF